MIYNYKYQIHFDECDPAGILFFANTWDICHRVFESWLLELKNDWSFWFNNPQWLIPIVSSKCDFKSPLPAGTTLDVELTVKKIGISSFVSFYSFKKKSKLFLECTLTHVFVDKKIMGKISVPEEVKKLFIPYLELDQKVE